MASKSRVTKAKSPKAPKAPKAPKTGSARSTPPQHKVVDVDSLAFAPRKRRSSKFDSLAQALLANPSKALVVSLPEGADPAVHRTMLYGRLTKCLDFFKPDHGKKISISLLKDGNLALQLVAAE